MDMKCQAHVLSSYAFRKKGGVAYVQMALIVSKELDDHPERFNSDPEYLVLDAMRRAFPCPASPMRK